MALIKLAGFVMMPRYITISVTADIILVISFAKTSHRKMIQNLAWAIGYNVIAIPLAAGILYPRFVLSPAMGAVLMSLSTVIVAHQCADLEK